MTVILCGIIGLEDFHLVTTLLTICFQYLDENPDAVLDARLMSGLNTMATNLVERTFEDRAASVRCRMF